jgi:ureidoacrylate peracid hydrolase
LDLHLKKCGIHKLIVIGLIAHTCIEATVRYAAELGYEVTVVKDATADYSDEIMRAALDSNMPNYASAVVGTKEIVASISTANVTQSDAAEPAYPPPQGGRKRRAADPDRDEAGPPQPD